MTSMCGLARHRRHGNRKGENGCLRVCLSLSLSLSLSVSPSLSLSCLLACLLACRWCGVQVSPSPPCALALRLSSCLSLLLTLAGGVRGNPSGPKAYPSKARNSVV